MQLSLAAAPLADHPTPALAILLAEGARELGWPEGEVERFSDGRVRAVLAAGDFRGKAGGYRIGYASSGDLVDWQRDDARAGIDVSEEGWDSEMISYPHVFTVDGATYMAYLGNQVGREGFGLAVLEGALA